MDKHLGGGAVGTVDERDANGLVAADGLDPADPMDASRSRTISTRRRVSPSRFPRITIAMGAAVLVCAGAAGLVAVVSAPVAPTEQFIDVALFDYTYELPSGTTCEVRTSAFDYVEPAAVAAIRLYAQSVDLVALASVNADLADSRDETPNPFARNEFVGPDEQTVVTDDDYTSAVFSAVRDLVKTEMHRRGFEDTAIGLTWSGELICPAAES
jgi:hypothetical protein